MTYYYYTPLQRVITAVLIGNLVQFKIGSRIRLAEPSMVRRWIKSEVLIPLPSEKYELNRDGNHE